jgi:hypothetical protein
MLEYERRFNDLLMFALHHVPTKQHMIEKFRNRLGQELKWRLIAIQFGMKKDLTKAT